MKSPPPTRRRRWSWLLALLVPLLLVAAVAAVSWQYSDDVLVPDFSGAPYDLEVIEADPLRVTLPRDENTERPGVYGLQWQGGEAILGPVVATSGDTVTRRIRSGGEEPAPGTMTRLDSDTFSGNPRSARGLPFTRVEYASELGPMPAWRIGGESDTWAVLVHGINGDPRTGLRIAPVLARLGITALLIRYRNDPGAPPSPDGMHHMGLTEWRDLEAAAHYAIGQGARELVLFGYSMGGAITTQFMENSRLAPRVRAMVLDAPALDWAETIAFGARQLGLPSLAAAPVRAMVGLRIEADWDRLDAVRQTDQLTVPTLLFHGTEDTVVPIETSEEFAAALPESVIFHRVPEAGHVQSWNVNPSRYESRVRDFLRQTTATTGSATAGQPRSRPPARP